MSDLLGASVLYWAKIGAPARAARVANVNQDGTLNLSVLGAGGEVQPPERRVPLISTGDRPPNGPYCRERAA